MTFPAGMCPAKFTTYVPVLNESFSTKRKEAELFRYVTVWNAGRSASNRMLK
jgi:hypothetical protein